MASYHGAVLLSLEGLLLLLTSSCVHSSEVESFPPPPRTYSETFYLQVIIGNGTNNAIATNIPVAGIQGRSFDLSQFGTVYVFDVNITATPSRYSSVIGKSYGTFVVTSLKGYIYQIAITFTFTSGELAGSTFSSLGIFNWTQPVSYFPIVGGTEALTYATGYTESQQIAQEPNIIIQVKANYKIA